MRWGGERESVRQVNKRKGVEVMLEVNVKMLHVDKSERRCSVNMTRCEECMIEGLKGV